MTDNIENQMGKDSNGVLRSFELSRDMWKMVADISSTALDKATTPHLVEGCRVLAARANYYGGEPEDKRGLIQGELPQAEWAALQWLMEEFADDSLLLKAFAKAVIEFDPDQPISIMKKDCLKENDEQMRRDAERINCPKSLQTIIEVLDFMFTFSKRTRLTVPKETESALQEMTGVPFQIMWKSMMGDFRSARKKLKALLEDIQRPDECGTAHLLISALEARAVYGMLMMFKIAAFVEMEVPPELSGNKEELDQLLGCAVRFFGRIADEGEAVEKLA